MSIGSYNANESATAYIPEYEMSDKAPKLVLKLDKKKNSDRHLIGANAQEANAIFKVEQPKWVTVSRKRLLKLC